MPEGVAKCHVDGSFVHVEATVGDGSYFKDYISPKHREVPEYREVPERGGPTSCTSTGENRRNRRIDRRIDRRKPANDSVRFRRFSPVFVGFRRFFAGRVAGRVVGFFAGFGRFRRRFCRRMANGA